MECERMDASEWWFLLDINIVIDRWPAATRSRRAAQLHFVDKPREGRQRLRTVDRPCTNTGISGMS
jgi:hypothetical protein